jgi:hypothetical protein
MAANSYSLPLAATAKRVSDAFGDGANVVQAAHNLPFRQLLLQATGASAAVGGDNSVTLATGTQLAVGVVVTIGPFDTGPVKLSDFYAIGAGATLSVLGVPF